MSKIIAIGAAVTMVAVVGGTFAVTQLTTPTLADCGSTAVGGGAIGGPFELINAAGETVTDQDIIIEPTILYFGYTFCPDVCPIDMARNAAAVDILEERGIDATPVFITIDPARDTVEALADYVTYFHPRLIGLTGSPAQIKQALQKYKVYAARVATPEEGADSYTMDHSSLFYLMDQQNRFVHHFDHTKAPEDMAADLLKFVR